MNLDRARQEMTPNHLAALVAELPPGAQTWRATGGSMAWTDEMYLIAGVEHATRVLAWQKSKDGQNGSNPPQMIDPPESEYERMSQDAKIEAKVRAHIERENKRAQLEQAEG